MADDEFDELVKKQENSYQNIKDIVTNYGKDSADRKTVEYLDKRINALESHWAEFCCNHELIKNYQATKLDADYFAKNIFTITQSMFNDTLQKMTRQRIDLLIKPGTSRPAPEKKREIKEVHVDGDSEHIKSLLNKQICNFNAMERAVAKVDLKRMHEKWQLQDQLSILQSKWESIDKLHWEVSYLLKGENKSYEETFSYWEETFDKLKEDINRKIWESSHYEKSTPKIDLPEFNGTYNNWVSFRDLFYETIHNNPTLNKTQKMKFLKSKLKGEAEKLIKHLSVSADNYDSCLEIILHRYNNKRLLFTSYIDTLLNQPSIIEKANAASVKKLHDTTKECINALENLGIDIQVWGPLIVHLLSSKLDDVTHADYIKNLGNSRELPDLDEFMEFLEVKFMSLETARTKKGPQKHNFPAFQHKSNNDSKPMNFKRTEKWTKTYHASLRNCPLCKGDHALRQCAAFLDMDTVTRNQTTSNLKICKNCLYSHGGNKCTSVKRCRTCNYKHHSLLHDDNFKGQQQPEQPLNRSPSSSNHINSDDQEILLTTLQLRVKTREGHYITLRALLDQGSQITLITENAAQRLNLPRSKMNAAVTGVGTIMGTSKGMVTLECKSIHSDYTFTTQALVMRKLINNLPNCTINTENWKHLDNIKLADPDFNISGPIDILLGADIYSEVILEGVLKQDQNSPVAQQTKLGWIICGATKQFNCLVTLNELENLAHFWETEQIPTEPEQSSNDKFCEDFYTKTTSRLDNGRYVVQMPMKPDYEQYLGNSKRQAIAQFLQLEKKMARQEHFANLYKQFIQDYIDLGHMKPATQQETNVQAFLPHHGVLRERSTTTKLRVVFNASMKTDSGHSLNDMMEKGPNLQKDILSLIIKWRSYKYVLTADIEKMYRQILIHQDQQCLQKIIWRQSAKDQLHEMQLCTLTYGTKAAPFIAMRTLLQLATDEDQAYPLGQKALKNDFYMDDVITGHHSIDTTRLLQDELYELLRKGGFILRKWATNESSILTKVQDNKKAQNNNFKFKQQEFSKTLGLAWNNTTDTFYFTCEIPTTDESKSYTKRRLLSEISKIYDPLGWLAPMTIQAKLIFQKLWTEKFQNIGWDQILPEEITKDWKKIKSELSSINKISLPRWIKNTDKTIELQGFCDASEHAYACVIYSRTTLPTGAYVTTLLAAKTKVAPLKNKTTVPKLELCGALLLAKLLQKVVKAFEDYELKISCWTDSKVVLAWLQGKQSKYERYITHRTTQIVSIVPASNWSYVKTNENPADCATRGLSPSKLLKYSLWFDGPVWLNKADLHTEKPPKKEIFITNEGLTQKCFTTEPVRNKNELINWLLNKYSDMDRITRTLAWILRFIGALRNISMSTKCKHLDLAEINRSKYIIIATIQQEQFGKEIQSLKEKGKLPNKSNILKLYPFLDNDGILRVGGRLEYSNLPAEMKHPAIIPHEGRLTQLIIEKAHQKTLHGGARLTLAHTRNQYWIVGGNRAVKKILRNCIGCRRFSANKNEQLMGNLPKERITPSRPFTHTGIDFTGHVEIKINKGRGIKSCKGYIAIFICMSTKAVHIELVSDMTTQTFIAALKRMCARRGTPKHIYTDNGTNFLGASKVLADEFEQYKTMLSPEFFRDVTELQIKWHFNAPAWPSAGGLWEAAVRSMKNHLKRVIGQQKLTYEQFMTLLTQIEASMNSRPLCPLSEDVEDLDYLTPGHFLTGGPTLSLPINEPEEMKSVDLRNNWKLIELMYRHYWNRWSQEYLHLLQNRGKWQQAKENLNKGQLVLIKESNYPPSKWAMGRIVELHPGSDGLVRVVTIKTQNGVLKRPISKLTPLPLKEACDVKDAQKQEDKKENGSKKSPTNKKFNSLFMLLLLAFATLYPVHTMTTGQPNYKITKLNDNHPIYFDPIGNIQLIHNEWKLLVYYNLTTFWESTTKVEKFVQHLAQICDTMPKEPCHSTINQLKFETKRLDEYNKLLLTQHLQRKKRGYVNGIGNLARTLFGVLDDKFAEKYAQDIQKIKNNEQYLLELIRNETLIIEAENSIIKKNEEFVNAQFELIQRHMEEMQYDLSVIENRAQIMKTMNDVNAGALTATLLITTLRKSQEMMLNALSDIYRGHLDRNLFTPDQLKEQLKLIAGVISKRLTLPIKNYSGSNIQNIYKIIYVKALLTKQYLLFELHIPLTSDDEYTLYNNIPIARSVSHKQCQRISITSQYIAVNFAKATYLQLEEADLQQCTMAMEDSYICHAYRPTKSLHGPTASCEAKMLSQNVNISCDWIEHQCNDQWRKLHRPNIWLYNCISECPTRIVCENQVTSTIITMAGLLALGQDCIIQHKDSTIYSYNVFGSETKIGINLEVPTIDSPNDIMDSYKSKQFVLSQRNRAEEHRMLDKQITVQKEHEHLPYEISVHDITNYSISSFLVGGIAIAILWRFRHRIFKCKKTENSTTETLKDGNQMELQDHQQLQHEEVIKKLSNQQPKPVRREFKL